MTTKMSQQVKHLPVTEALSVAIIPSKAHEFLMTTDEVAHGYDCSSDAILKTRKRNQSDFENQKHYFKGLDNLSAPLRKNLQPNQIYWTKRGVIRLGFFIKSSRAKLFRDWAEDLILEKLNNTYKLNFRDAELEVLALIKKHLVLGDVKKVAKDLQLHPTHVSHVKNGKRRSARVFKALAEKAAYNKEHNIVNGYKAELIQYSLNLFNPQTALS